MDVLWVVLLITLAVLVLIAIRWWVSERRAARIRAFHNQRRRIGREARWWIDQASDAHLRRAATRMRR
jgi:hypothetical protein